MNRKQRRETIDRCCKRLKSSRAYLLITSDGKGMPVYTYDLEMLGKDDTDIRVIAMQGAVGGAMSMLSKADDMLKERIEAKRVEEEKARLVENTVVSRETPPTTPEAPLVA